MKDISMKYLPGDVDLMKGGSSKNVILIENFLGTPCVWKYSFQTVLRIFSKHVSHRV